MEISINISDVDLFKLFRLKFSKSKSDYHDSQAQDFSIFTEHCDVLELLWGIEKNLDNTKILQSERLNNLVEQTNDTFSQLFQVRGENLGIWEINQAIQLRCFLALQNIVIEAVKGNSSAKWELLYLKNSPNVELYYLVELIKYINSRLDYRADQLSAIKQNEIHLQLQERKYQELLSLFKMYGSFFTACLNFHFPNKSRFLNYENFAQQRNKNIDFIKKNLLEIEPSLVKAFYKYEDDGERGFKFSCILIYVGSAKKTKKDLINFISKKLDSLIAEYPIQLEDWGEKIEQLAYPSPFGNLKNEEQLRRFFYWAVSPYFRYEQFFRLRSTSNFNTALMVNTEFTRVYSGVKLDKFVDYDQPLNVSQFNNYTSSVNLVWGTKHLDKVLQEKNKVALIYYRELQFEGREGSFYDPAYLYYLSIFIDTLAQQREDFFILTFGALKQEKQIRVTRLGNQLLFLLEKFVPFGIEAFEAFSTYNQKLCGRFDLLLHSDIWSKMREIVARKDIRLTVKHLKDFNTALEKTYFASGINHVIVPTIDYSATFITEKALYKDECFSYYDKRTIEAQKYVRAFFKQDRLLARFQVSYDFYSFNSETLRVAFSTAFTEFIRISKRTELLRDMVGYFLVWLDDHQNKPYVDLIVILNCTDISFKNQTMLAQMLDKAWAEFLQRRHLVNGPIQPNSMSSEFKSTLIMQSAAALCQHSVLIERLNKELQKEIIHYLVPYFTYRHFFLPYHIENNKKLPVIQQKLKLFSRGAVFTIKKPKKKVTE